MNLNPKLKIYLIGLVHGLTIAFSLATIFIKVAGLNRAPIITYGQVEKRNP